jgi:hypothetical protein
MEGIWRRFLLKTKHLQEQSVENSLSDTFLHIDSPDPNQNLDLVISYRSRSLPKFLPGITDSLGNEMRTDVSGIALIENQR